jgi:hypothetical protein
MAEGIVVSIHLASGATEPMRGVDEARAVPGRGLEGDRYFEGRGTFSGSPDTELTLVEARRNVVTRGVDLNGLVGEEFRVGEVLLRGVRPAEPCAHLARLVGARIARTADEAGFATPGPGRDERGRRDRHVPRGGRGRHPARDLQHA